MYIRIIIIAISLLTFFACSPEESVDELNLISITVDGSNVSESITGVSTSPNVAITFDAAIDITRFEEELSILPEVTNLNVSYSNANSKANISFELESNSTYNLQLPATTIGANGQTLSTPIDIELSTEAGSTSACTSTSSECTNQLTFTSDGVNYSLDFFRTYPLGEPDESNQIKNAIILIHGANRNNDDYFNWMNNTLTDLSLQSNTVLIAPQFKDDSEVADASELYWNSNNWREGDDSGNDYKVSSFAIIDNFIQLLVANYNLDQIIVTGHSSGGLFTHLYGASNVVETDLGAGPQIKYLVANSQYFYYPTEERVNESNNQFFVPENCTGYDFWPLGFNITPPYVSQYTQDEFNNQFLSRDIHYLLGNGEDNDPSLNTDECRTQLLGSTRYNRGENMYYFIQEKYPENNHSRTIVQGIGHNGQAMYQSEEFKELLANQFN